MCAKFCCALLHIKKALGIFRELITTTTRVGFWDPPSSGSKKNLVKTVELLVTLTVFIQIFFGTYALSRTGYLQLSVVISFSTFLAVIFSSR